MPTWAWIIIGVAAAIVVLAAIAAAWTRKRRSAGLQERFGPEYERTVAERGKRGKAEEELAERERKREKLDIVPLSPESRQKYGDTWRNVQARFVDEPAGTVVMRERGYPIDDFDQRAADLSVDHPEVVENYRSAHAIYVSHERGRATTEDLRQAFVHYRALFEELLEERVPASQGAR